MIRHATYIVLGIVAALYCFVLPAQAQADNADDAKPTLWIIGDSTVKYGAGPGVGWGEVIDQHFDLDRITVNNRAIGGRSSRTYWTEHRWADVLEQAKPGDFVLMQFGHNDGIPRGDKNPERGSLHGTGDETMDIVNPKTHEPETIHTYGWYMRQYVTQAQEKGLIPIVCSYVPRAPRRGQHANPELESYGLWAKQVADQEHAAFLDLFGRISKEHVKMEADRPHSVKETYFVGGDRDYTHTVLAGAEANARHVVAGIRDLEGDAGKLADYLKDEPTTKPTTKPAK